MEFPAHSRVLVLSAHTDDAEFAAGGSIAQWTSRGLEVHHVIFSACEESLPSTIPPDTLRKEAKAANAVLGIIPANLHILNFKVREFPRQRQEILQVLVDLNREIQPNIVVLPHKDDIHQDHSTLSLEGSRAFKRVNTLAYEIAWNHQAFPSNTFISLNDEDLDCKVRALDCYKSQKARTYSSSEFIRSQALVHGVIMGASLAEPFQTMSWFWRS